MKKVYKFLILLSLIIICVIIVILVVTQVSYEKYINYQKTEYKLLQNRKRLLYKPAFIYYLESVMLNKKELNKDALELLRIGSNYKQFNVEYIKDEYILEWFYTKEEKEVFVIAKNKVKK